MGGIVVYRKTLPAFQTPATFLFCHASVCWQNGIGQELGTTLRTWAKFEAHFCSSGLQLLPMRLLVLRVKGIFWGKKKRPTILGSTVFKNYKKTHNFCCCCLVCRKPYCKSFFVQSGIVFSIFANSLIFFVHFFHFF